MTRLAELRSRLPSQVTDLGSITPAFDAEGVEWIRLTPSDQSAVKLEVRLTPFQFEVHAAGTELVTGSIDADGEWAVAAAAVISTAAAYGVRIYRRPRWLERLVSGPGGPGAWFLSPRAELTTLQPWGKLPTSASDPDLRRTHLFRGMERLFAG